MGEIKIRYIIHRRKPYKIESLCLQCPFDFIRYILIHTHIHLHAWKQGIQSNTCEEIYSDHILIHREVFKWECHFFSWTTPHAIEKVVNIWIVMIAVLRSYTSNHGLKMLHAEQRNSHILIISAQKVEYWVKSYLGDTLMLTGIKLNTFLLLFWERYGLMSYIYTTFNVEVKDKIGVIKKRLTPEDNGIDWIQSRNWHNNTKYGYLLGKFK